MTDSRNNSSARLNYTQSFTFDAIETVTVAAGVFPNACRVLSKIDITGDFGRDSSSDTRWKRCHVGRTTAFGQHIGYQHRTRFSNL